MDPQMANKINRQRKKSGSRHKQNKISLNESINNININKIVSNPTHNDDIEDDESLSELSDGGNNPNLRDENLNQQYIKQYPMKSKTSVQIKSDGEEDKNDHMDPNDDTDEDNRAIERTKSSPSDAGSHKMMKQKAVPKRSKTRS